MEMEMETETETKRLAASSDVAKIVSQMGQVSWANAVHSRRQVDVNSTCELSDELQAALSGGSSGPLTRC